jgi:hypothetical protein
MSPLFYAVGASGILYGSSCTRTIQPQMTTFRQYLLSLRLDLFYGCSSIHNDCSFATLGCKGTKNILNVQIYL